MKRCKTLEKELRRESQVRCSEMIMVFSNGQIVSRELRNKDEYIEIIAVTSRHFCCVTARQLHNCSLTQTDTTLSL